MLKVENMPPVQQEGEGKNREKKDHIAKRSFSGKTKKKADNLKTYSTQFTAHL